jgi:hypothetical protein
MVFAEILSVIKGSLASLEQPKGFLTQEAYLEVPPHRSSATGHHRRVQVYQLFLAYEREKKARGAYDMSDAVFYIYDQLTRFGYPKGCVSLDRV